MRAQPQAILFSDLRDFTSFTAQRGDAEAFRLARRFVDLTAEAVDRHHGRVVKTYGDGVMTAFSAASHAVLCAAEIQRCLTRRNQGEEGDFLSAGIGLAWGSPICADDDLFGTDVNLAKRLADLAKGEQIIASAEVKAQAEEVEGVRYLELGDRSIPGLGRRRLVEVVWRPEVARLTSEDDSLTLVLAEDRLVAELSKDARQQIDEVQAELREAAAKESGLARLILKGVERAVGERLPRIIDRSLYAAGVGVEHAISQVDVAVEGDKLVVRVRGRGGLRLPVGQFAPRELEEFLAEFRAVKSKEDT
ncbi:MAG: adenylate/guanylate cyclase domain-containing protein [Candidatus Bipolaricaulaceae bacterium]